MTLPPPSRLAVVLDAFLVQALLFTPPEWPSAHPAQALSTPMKTLPTERTTSG